MLEAVNSIAKEHEIKLNEADLVRITVEETKEKAHGDLATNVAMILAKSFSIAPLKLAQMVANAINIIPIETLFVFYLQFNAHAWEQRVEVYL